LRTPRTDPELVRGRGKVAATIFVAHAIKHIYSSGQSSLIMPEIKIGLGLSRAQYGSLGTASSIAWWASTMVAGYLGDRFTNRAGIMLAIALGLMGGTYFVAGFAPNYTTMLVVMFLAGIGPALFHPPAIGELSRRFPDRRGFAVSLHGMAANIGEVLGAPTVAVFLTFMVWRDLLKVSAGPALLAAFAILILMPSRRGETRSEVSSIGGYFTSLVSLLNNRVLLLLIVATALRSVGEGAVGGFLSLYMRDDLKYSVTTVAIFLSAAQIAGVVSQPVMGYLSDKIGRKPVLVTGTGLVMLSAFALSVARSGVQLFLAVLVKGAFSFSLHHIFVAAALDAGRGAAQSTVVSLIYGAGFLGTFSPYIAGLISDHYGIHSAFVFGGSVLILPTVLLAVARFPSPAPVLETEPEGRD
jgi:FSR family fosmidomycin resistance protein-like MFS transporter